MKLKQAIRPVDGAETSKHVRDDIDTARIGIMKLLTLLPQTGSETSRWR